MQILLPSTHKPAESVLKSKWKLVAMFYRISTFNDMLLVSSVSIWTCQLVKMF